MTTLQQDPQEIPKWLSEEEKNIVRATYVLSSEVEIQLIIDRIEQSVQWILTFRQVLTLTDSLWKWQIQRTMIVNLVRRIPKLGK